MKDGQEILYYIYLGGDSNPLEGYLIGWEYPLPWIQEPQTESTENLALEFPDVFEAGYEAHNTTIFPNPNVPRPPRK